VAQLRVWSLRLTIAGFVALALTQTLVASVPLFVTALVVVMLGLAGFVVALVLRTQAAR